MALDIQQLDSDTSFLLSFQATSPELLAAMDAVNLTYPLSPEVQAEMDAKIPRAFTILLDPVIKALAAAEEEEEDPLKTSTDTLADKSTTSATTATSLLTSSTTNDNKLTLASLRDLPEAPHLIIISQAGAEHCDKATLCQLPGSGTRTLIIAEPAAAHKIHSWNHFDRDKVRILEPWEDPRLVAEYRPVVARVVVPTMGAISGFDVGLSSQFGQPGEITVSLIMPETNGKYKKQSQQKAKKQKRRGSGCGLSAEAAAVQAALGIGGAIGITYRPPTIPGLEPINIPVDKALHEHQNRRAALPAEPPSPPERWGNGNGNNNGEGSSTGNGYGNHYLRKTKTLSIIASDAESVLNPSVVPISPRSLRSVQSATVLHRSPSRPTFQPPFLTRADNTMADLNNNKYSNNSYAHLQPQRRAPHPPPSMPISKQMHALMEKEDREREQEHQKQRQRPTSHFYKPRPTSSAAMSMETAKTNRSSSSNGGNTTTYSTSTLRASRMAAAKKAAAAAARPLSVIYAPHGTSFAHLEDWTHSHLVQEAALPLTALLHPMDGVVVGPAVRAKFQAATQRQSSSSSSQSNIRPASAASTSSSWSSWSALGLLRFGGSSHGSIQKAAAAAAATRSSVVCHGAEIASRMAARAWISINDGGAARGSRRWACDDPPPSTPSGSDPNAKQEAEERKRLSALRHSKNGGGSSNDGPKTKVLRLGGGRKVTVCADEVLRPDWAEDDYYMEDMQQMHEDDDEQWEDVKQEEVEEPQKKVSFADTPASFANSQASFADRIAAAHGDQVGYEKKKYPPVSFDNQPVSFADPTAPAHSNQAGYAGYAGYAKEKKYPPVALTNHPVSFTDPPVPFANPQVTFTDTTGPDQYEQAGYVKKKPSKLRMLLKNVSSMDILRNSNNETTADHYHQHDNVNDRFKLMKKAKSSTHLAQNDMFEVMETKSSTHLPQHDRLEQMKTKSSTHLPQNDRLEFMKTKSSTQSVSMNEFLSDPNAPGHSTGNSNFRDNDYLPTPPPLKKKKGLRNKASFILGLSGKPKPGQ